MNRSSAIALMLSALLCPAPPPATARDGVADPAFGNHAPGISIIDIAPDPELSLDEATAVAALPGGGLLLAGTSLYGHTQPTRAFSLVRLDANGQRDPAFGNDGTSLIGIDPGVSAPQLVTVLPRADGGWLVLARGVSANVTVLLLCRVGATGAVESACVPLPPPAGIVFRPGPAAAMLDDKGRILTLTGIGPPTFSYNEDLSVARWHADGTPDTDFGDAGATTITRLDELAGQATREVASAIAVDAQGRIVVAASSYPRGPAGDGTATFAVARLLGTGVHDASFGNGGARTLPSAIPLRATALALADDGSPVVVGSVEAPSLPRECAVARFDAGGTIDTGFGDAGLVRFAFRPGAPDDDDCVALALQPDGRLVVAGASRAPADGTSGYDFAAARLWPDGRVDDGFGNAGNGRWIGAIDLAAPFGNFDQLGAILWHDQHLVLVGHARSGYNLSELVAVRLRADGLLDDGFE